jgi:hypothetical protein
MTTPAMPDDVVSGNDVRQSPRSKETQTIHLDHHVVWDLDAAIPLLGAVEFCCPNIAHEGEGSGDLRL